MIGAIIGDTVGSAYEFNNVKTKDFERFTKHSVPTDDSIMTLAVAEILQNHWYEDHNKIVDTFKKWGNAYPDAGYGGRFSDWLFSDDRAPYGSYGNGAAMRVSPCGWYGRNEDEVKRLSRAVTEATHDHPEGIKGAEVTAMCVYYARIGKSKDYIRDYVSQYYSLDFDYDELVANYYHGDEICQVTVPQAIYCFLISKDFEDCLATTISIGGDCDTTAAISCAIAEAYYRDIPADLLKKTLYRLPAKHNDCNAKEIVNRFRRFQLTENVTSEEYQPNTYYVCKITTINDKSKMEWIHNTNWNTIAQYISYEVTGNLYDTFVKDYSPCGKDALMVACDDFNLRLMKRDSNICYWDMPGGYSQAIAFINAVRGETNKTIEDIFSGTYYGPSINTIDLSGIYDFRVI